MHVSTHVKNFEHQLLNSNLTGEKKCGIFTLALSNADTPTTPEEQVAMYRILADSKHAGPVAAMQTVLKATGAISDFVAGGIFFLFAASDRVTCENILAVKAECLSNGLRPELTTTVNTALHRFHDVVHAAPAGISH